ncbi:MAG TPA: GspE/PulE family protein [Xanthobacteraceae bacterium]|nr:GspE/PulE family protein [Xanthobacteraceae bacterium]
MSAQSSSVTPFARPRGSARRSIPAPPDLEQGPRTQPPERVEESPSPVCRDPQAGAFADCLGAFLLARNIIDRPALDRAQRAAQATRERFDHVLTKLGLLSEADLAGALSQYLSLPIVSAADLPAEPLLLDLIEPDFVRRNRILPLALSAETVTIGVIDPFADEPMRAIGFLTERSVVVRVFPPAEFDKALRMLYATSGRDGPASAGTPDGADASEIDVQRLRDLASEAPVIRLVNQIIANAVESRASDIHIEPTVDVVTVRYRIDGALRTVQTLSPALRAAVTSRIKIVAKLDIAERRMPQDGRIKIAVRGTDIDFRVSTIPTAFGESVVMRILDRSRVALDFAKLGFDPQHVATFIELIRHPNGIVLVTGPTGSGKTTTLYTALQLLDNSERKIFTVEDPIEYQLAGTNQVQVHAAIGLTFPHALRSILRQDPDIIMIGEIRDLETARIAIQASLTGHLVLSTLHTNSAAATITRLIDMGVEHYLLASTVRGILAQRLVRRLCTHCSGPHERSGFWADELRGVVTSTQTLGPADIRQARGCDLCGGTGYSGRTTIAEILPLDSAINSLVASQAGDAEVERLARERGMASMYANGMVKAWHGVTTVEEVLRATKVV